MYVQNTKTKIWWNFFFIVAFLPRNPDQEEKITGARYRTGIGSDNSAENNVL